MDFDGRPGTQARAAPVQRLALGRTRQRLSFERRVRLWIAAAAVPLLLASAVLCNQGDLSIVASTALLGGIAVLWIIVASYFFESLVRPLQTLSNIVAALREEDFSFRARGARRGDALGDLVLEINALASTLQRQRNSALDALALADRVMSSMPSPVLAFDAENRLRLLNAAGERAFALQRRSVLGRTAGSLGLQILVRQRDESVFPALDADALGASPRWSVRRSAFRLHGVPHTLFVLSDVAAALREEERVAWQRLIRVLGHEMNNSLTPIKSIASTLRSRPVPTTGDTESAQGWEELHRGLFVIEDRADSLNRFLEGYQQLSRLPQPTMRQVSLCALLERTLPLERRLRVEREPSLPDVVLQADPDQLQQLLINLLKNAADAALDPEVTRSPSVLVRWFQRDSQVVIQIIDNGLGLANAANLFVPFYTTKPGGAGIGLTLSRQIAAAHGGSLLLHNREGQPGCLAEVSLPRQPAPV